MVHLTKRQGNLVRHQGGCHCGAVRFEALASPNVTVFQCNCSICVKKQIKYFLVPFNQFKLVKGHNSLQTYSFNTHQAKYNFCSTCGVQSFHIPSTNPEAYGIAMHCLDEGTLKKVTYEKIDSKKETQPKRKASSGDKASSPTLGGLKPDSKSQDQPVRKNSFIEMINSWTNGQFAHSSSNTTTNINEKNQVQSTQDSTTTESNSVRPTLDSATSVRSTQDSATAESNSVRATLDSPTSVRSTQDSATTESNSVRATLDTPIIKIEGKSPQQARQRKFIVTKVLEQIPRDTPCL